MKFSRKIKALVIGLAAGALFGVLSMQDCDSELSIFEIGPTSDLPELSVPRVLTPPYLVPPREAPLDDSPVRVAIKTEPPRLHHIVPLPKLTFGNAPFCEYRVPLYWRIGNPSTAPPSISFNPWNDQKMMHNTVFSGVEMAKVPNDKPPVEADFTERVLLSLVFDVTCLADNVEQVKVKIFAMAREHGLKTPAK